MRGLRGPSTAAIFLLAVALVTGCGSGDNAGEVSGAITYDGKPVESGAITFYPEKGPTAGGIIKDGKYTATVAVGPTKVSITGSKIIGEKKIYNTPNSGTMPISIDSLPAKYNKTTQLRYDVQPGTQTKDFDLPK